MLKRSDSPAPHSLPRNLITLFTSQKGGRLDRTQFFRILQAGAEAAGLPAEKRHSHCLKHSLASHLVAGNVNLALIK